MTCVFPKIIALKSARDVHNFKPYKAPAFDFSPFQEFRKNTQQNYMLQSLSEICSSTTVAPAENNITLRPWSHGH